MKASDLTWISGIRIHDTVYPGNSTNNTWWRIGDIWRNYKIGNVHRGAHSTYWFRDMMTRKIYNIGWSSWNDNHFGGYS